MTPNTLYFGDNLHVLRDFPDACVDLVYLDPPFNSKRDYNYIYRDIAGAGDTAQEQAFSDTWTMEGAAADFTEVTESGWPEGTLLDALHRVHGDSSLVAYLAVMARRLRELHRVLKPTGSLYLHCDPTASHYLKMVLDCVFGAEHFRNEVCWQRTAPKGHAFTRFASTHDVLLAYGRDATGTWNASFQPYRQEYIKSHYSHQEEGTGRRYQLDNCLNPNPDRPNLTYEWKGVTRVWRWTKERMQRLHDDGRLVYSKSGLPRYKRYLDEMPGTPTTDVWIDIPPINSQAAERLGYPTQKPLALLERIISASSNPGDLVLDPFCGCGTAVVAAQKLGRQWVGIDITSLAVNLIRERLSDHWPNLWPSPGDVPVNGLPKDVASALMLFESNPYDFQFWALTLVGAHPPGGARKKGAGVDGEVLWRDGQGTLQRGIVEVKGGRTVGLAMLEKLIGEMDKHQAAVALFVTLAPPTKPMRDRAALAGTYQMAGTTATYQRVQILTIEELLAGARPDLPKSSRLEAHQPAAKLKPTDTQQGTFDLDA